jgi:hypothetical protein
LSKIREIKNINQESRLEKQKALLTALAKATGEKVASCNDADDANDDANSYYILNHEELEALINGNIERIENWVGNLDRRHATLILRWLIKENG